MASARDHEQNRKPVCVLCLKKANRKLSDLNKEKINSVLQTSIHFYDSRVPTGIYESCMSTLRRASEGQKENFSPLFDFMKITLTITTRESSTCECFIC